MQNTEGRELPPPAEQIPKPNALVIGKASATKPPLHSLPDQLRSFLWAGESPAS